jgi:hypothetical protein
VDLKSWGTLSHHLPAEPETLRTLQKDERAWRDDLGALAMQAEEMEKGLDAGMRYLPPSPYAREEKGAFAASTFGWSLVPLGLETGNEGDSALSRATASAHHGGRAGLFVPDGLATAEWYGSPGVKVGDSRAEGLVRRGWTISRPEHVVTSWVIGTEDRDVVVGDFQRTWVCGQAGGSRSYLDSLASGGVVARAVARELC